MYQISWKFLKLGPSCSMRTDGRTDRHAEANSRFSQIGERAYKIFVDRNYAYGLYYRRTIAMY